MPSVDTWENDQKQEVIQSLREQLEIEGQLVSLYEKYERNTENRAIKRVMQMFRLDSQRHINIIQAAIELLEGEDVYIEDKEPLKESLAKHLELEAEALKRANNILGKIWVDETKGLKELLQIWRDDEKRHHAALKKPDNTDLLQDHQQRHGGPLQGRGLPGGQVPQIEAIQGENVPNGVNASFKPSTPSYSP